MDHSVYRFNTPNDLSLIHIQMCIRDRVVNILQRYKVRIATTNSNYSNCRIVKCFITPCYNYPYTYRRLASAWIISVETRFKIRNHNLILIVQISPTVANRLHCQGNCFVPNVTTAPSEKKQDKVSDKAINQNKNLETKSKYNDLSGSDLGKNAQELTKMTSGKRRTQVSLGRA